MRLNQPQKAGIVLQFWHFVLHLRIHYQLFILSGGYLLGGVFSNTLDIGTFFWQFLNVHLLLFGGATAYNSYWDKDEGPIGGLKNPPKMQRWMWVVSLALQAIGALLAFVIGWLFLLIYLSSMLFFWLYSTPLARWKGRPIKSLFAIGISTGFNSVLLGYLAAGNSEFPLHLIVIAVGVTLMLLSLYPLSQIYQQKEDKGRGDQTFALHYGKSGVVRFFGFAFFTGLLLISVILAMEYTILGILFGGIGIVVGVWIYAQLIYLSVHTSDYRYVMRIKYVTSMAFVAFLALVLILKHSDMQAISTVADLLLR